MSLDNDDEMSTVTYMDTTTGQTTQDPNVLSADQLFECAKQCGKQTDHQNMEKYYLLAIEKGHVNAMCNLGIHYQRQKEYAKMNKYYIQAIENGSSCAMYQMARFSEDQKDLANAIKYYLMAIDRGCVDAMNELGYFYHDQKDYSNMMKYYLMAIEHGDDTAMHNLGYYYQEQKDHVNMNKYFMMALDKRNTGTMEHLVSYYRRQKDHPNMMKYYAMCVQHNKMNVWNMVREAQINKCIPLCFAALMNILEHPCEKTSAIQSACVKLAIENKELLGPLLLELATLRKTNREKDVLIQELKLMPEGPDYAAAKQRFENRVAILTETRSVF